VSVLLAFEGGATATQVGLYTEDRQVLAETTAGPCNATEYGLSHCVDLLHSAARSLTDERPSLAAAGISGAKEPALRDGIARALCTELGAARALVTDDLHPILFASAGTNPALLVIAGTGSSVLAQTGDGQSVLIGGRGRLFGDEGSAYQIAVQALRAAAHALDGMGPPTGLVGALPAAAGVATFADMVRWGAEASKRDIAALAKTVDALAADGDEVAVRCITGQAECLAAQTIAAAGRLSLPVGTRIYLNGGLFQHSSPFLAAYNAALIRKNPDARCARPVFRGHRAVLELGSLSRPVPAWVSECTEDCGRSIA
jgi:N-acetylglucosamine kinase-like BadF-type ATPase